MKRRWTYTPPKPSPREQDYQLAYCALDGNDEAWEILYEDAFPFVVSRVKNMDAHKLFSAEDYDDIADEALHKCYEQLERYQGRSRFRYWVLGYARNIMRDRRSRQATARRNQYLLEQAAQSRFRASDPLYILIHLERDRCLWEAFFDLEKVEQIILFESVFFHIPPRTLAKKLQLTRRQVLHGYESACWKTRWSYLRRYR